MNEFEASKFVGEALAYLKRMGYSFKSVTTNFRESGVTIDIEFQEPVKDEDRKLVD